MSTEIQFDYEARRKALEPLLADAGVDAVWLPIGADLEYLTGIQRRVPTFGEVNYAHGWVAGALLAPDREPIFVLPRNYVEFDLPKGVPGEVHSVSELDDGDSIFARVAGTHRGATRIAIGARTWGSAVMRILEAFPEGELVNATKLVNKLRRIKTDDELELMRGACHIADSAMAETAGRVEAGVTEMDLAEEVNHQLVTGGARTWSFDTAVWSMGPLDDRDASERISHNPLVRGMGVSFDFGSVYQSYCSDFGRTIHVGEPDHEYRRAYDVVMAAQQAGIDKVRPGVTAAEVHHATRQVIVDAGYGEWFRHRTGHCIGLDVHEEPFISEEDNTPLEAGMTFTIEPSIFWPGTVGVRVEDIILCTEQGGVKLNEHPTTMVAND